jgi:hypothetical protein
MDSTCDSALQEFTTYLGFEVLTAMVVKSTIFWDILPLTFNGPHGVISQMMAIFTTYLLKNHNKAD